MDRYRNLRLAVVAISALKFHSIPLSMYIASFYQFTKVAEPEDASNFVERLCANTATQGTILLATEGINAVLAHLDLTTLKAVIVQLETNLNLPRFRPSIAQADSRSRPFDKLLIKVRPEIVTCGASFDFELSKLPRATPMEWVSLIRQTDTVVLDVRNHYEFSLGRFRGAIQPETQKFREFKDFLNHQTQFDRDQTVAIYCTGGIRCEKAAQLMHKNGFKSVIQLDRGILGFLEDTEDSYWWTDECFVFDQRVAVNRTLKEGKVVLCLACGTPLTSANKTSVFFNHGISCPSCYSTLTPAALSRRKERLHQLRLTQKREASNPNTHNATTRVCQA